MLERCQVTASEIAGLEMLSQSSVSEAISQMHISKVNRLIVTDLSGVAVYDSAEQDPVLGEYVLFPEIVTATSGNNVFSWNYHAGTMLSRAAVPVYTYGTMIGCVYMTEYDTSQGMLLQSLLQNIFSITLILEILVVLFSFFFLAASPFFPSQGVFFVCLFVLICDHVNRNFSARAKKKFCIFGKSPY